MTQKEYERIISLNKTFEEKTINFPEESTELSLNAYSLDRKEYISITIRGNSFDATKVTNHSMYSDKSFLLRIDLGDRIRHLNPAVNGNQELIIGSHVHYFVEGYNDKWAITLKGYCEKIDIPYESLTNKYDVFELFCSKLNIAKDWRMQDG